MSIEFGIPTLIETKNLEECAELCSELGFQFVELNMNLPQYQLNCIDTHGYKEISEKFGIYFTIHLDENLNASDFNPLVAKAYTDTVLQTIDIAKKLNIPILNMHLSGGVYFTLPDRKVYLFDEYSDEYIQSMQAFRDKCSNELIGSGITICIENSSGYDKMFLQKGLAHLLESPVFGLTFDIGHNAAIGGGDESHIMQHKDKLCHMHIHDAEGKKDHMVLGTGKLDLEKYFKLADSNNCRVVLETKTISGLRQSADWFRQNISNAF